jgi:hypothetical protein
VKIIADASRDWDMRMIQSNTIRYLKAKLRQVLLTADPHERPEMLIKLTLLWGAYFEHI